MDLARSCWVYDMEATSMLTLLRWLADWDEGMTDDHKPPNVGQLVTGCEQTKEMHPIRV